MYDKLVSVIEASEIWKGERQNTHRFLLSPSVLQVSRDQNQELINLGYSIYDCLLGLSHIAVIAYDQDLNYRGIWDYIRRVFSSGVPKTYCELQGLSVRAIPKLLKVDFMVDQEGKFKIAEIDGHNKHGLGYSTLTLRFRESLYPDAISFPGTVKQLSEELKRLGYEEIKLFYADQERFYLPEFEVAGQEFAKHGINCVVVSESNLDETILESGMFLDLPFLHQRTELYDSIVPAYKNGDLQFIIPPKPFLGSKGVLALLRNDGENEILEGLLRSFIKPKSLDMVRQYIPETLLVGKHALGFDLIQERISRNRFVLKQSISSGMKGTVFSDDVRFDSVLRDACKSSMNWILQEEVANQPQTFSWYEKGKENLSELKTASDWYMRVTVQYVNRIIGDIIITARRSKAVHGAKDCLQIGTVIV